MRDGGNIEDNAYQIGECNAQNTIGNSEIKRNPFGIEGVTGFIESLIRKNIVSEADVNSAILLKKKNNGSDKRLLFQILIDEFHNDRELIYSEFVHYYSIKVIEYHGSDTESETLKFINKVLNSLPLKLREAALVNKILPFQVAENDSFKLQIVTPDPSNREIAAVARTFSYLKYEICYMPIADYNILISELFANYNSKPAEITTELIPDEFDTSLDELDEEIAKGHINELVEIIFADAVRLNASDIHIIPKNVKRTEIHFRLDGNLMLWQTIEGIRSDAIAAVVKDVTKGTDRFERNMAQDGFIQKNIENKVVRFRVSVIPLIGKELKMKLESIVLRVLRDPEESITIENVGFSPHALKLFKKAIEKPHGLVILTGPTGSGKSTTLLAALRAVMNPAYNIITVEDPVEYFIDGARQVKLNQKLGFDEALRAILRHDPDIVMVGEIRDRQTADFAIKLANTGHLTFSTLHTNDAASVISRLYKMGVEPFLLSYSINVIVAQRLLRKLCDRCRIIDTEISHETLKRIGLPIENPEGYKIYRPVGCLHCLKGYKGRTGIHEILYFTKEVRQLITDAGEQIDEETIRSLAIKQGMQTLRDSAIELLKKGITTIEEVISTTIDD
jgi:type IV pilus assembly protein PilB